MSASENSIALRPGAPARPQAPTAARDAGARRLSEDPRSSGLDGLRGIAALSVFVVHIWLYTRTPGPWSAGDTALFQLRVCVICFFVLSGYLLYRSFARAALRGKPVDLRLYYKRRIFRILPAYYVCLPIVYGLLSLAQRNPGVRLPDPSHLWLFAVMGQNHSTYTVMKLNSVTWTLAIESMFYVVLPVIGLFALHVARGRRRPQVGLCLALIAIGMVWHAWCFHAGLGQMYTKTILAYIPYFALGMLAALYTEWRGERDAGPLAHRRTALLSAAGIALVLFNGVWHATSGGPRSDPWIAIVHDLPAGAGFALLTVAAAVGLGRAIAWTRARPIVKLGVISYGFYLWQVPVILLVERVGLRDAGWPVIAAVAFAVSVLLGAASWTWLERPLIARAHRRRLTEPEKNPPTPQAQPTQAA